MEINSIYLKGRQIFFVLLAISLFVLNPGLNTACAGDIFVYCGAGLRQPVDKIFNEYKKATGKRVIIEYSGSGQALARYRATGKGDLFISGSQFYTDQLRKEGKVIESFPLVLHIPVVAVSRKSSGMVKSFADLSKPGVRVGLGDKKAMALGRTADMILDNSGLKEAILKNTVVRAATVKQLTLYVSKGNVDAAIIARADAFQNPEELVWFDIDPGWYKPETVTMAVLKSAQDLDTSAGIAEYFRTSHALEVFGKYGFLPVK